MAKGEEARIAARDSKRRKPKVVADNPGMRKLQLQLAEKLRSKRRSKPER